MNIQFYAKQNKYESTHTEFCQNRTSKEKKGNLAARLSKQNLKHFMEAKIRRRRRKKRKGQTIDD